MRGGVLGQHARLADGPGRAAGRGHLAEHAAEGAGGADVAPAVEEAVCAGGGRGEEGGGVRRCCGPGVAQGGVVGVVALLEGRGPAVVLSGVEEGGAGGVAACATAELPRRELLVFRGLERGRYFGVLGSDCVHALLDKDVERVYPDH